MSNGLVIAIIVGVSFWLLWWFEGGGKKSKAFRLWIVDVVDNANNKLLVVTPVVIVFIWLWQLKDWLILGEAFSADFLWAARDICDEFDVFCIDGNIGSLTGDIEFTRAIGVNKILNWFMRLHIAWIMLVHLSVWFILMLLTGLYRSRVENQQPLQNIKDIDFVSRKK